MATVSNYMFYDLSRIGDDQCSISGRDQQNNEFGTYTTTNYFANWCGMKKPIAFATEQPGIFYNGGEPCGAGGCNVSYDSKLKIGTIQTHPKCRISLYQRPFATVPFLGRGPSRPLEESKLQQGGFSGDKKSCKNLTEKTLRVNQELVPSLKVSIQNPANLCEGIAADGWIRGGLPSRELSRDKDYFTKCN